MSRDNVEIVRRFVAGGELAPPPEARRELLDDPRRVGSPRVDRHLTRDLRDLGAVEVDQQSNPILALQRHVDRAQARLRERLIDQLDASRAAVDGEPPLADAEAKALAGDLPLVAPPRRLEIRVPDAAGKPFLDQDCALGFERSAQARLQGPVAEQQLREQPHGLNVTDSHIAPGPRHLRGRYWAAMSQPNVEVVLNAHAAFSRGDLDAFLAECQPDVPYRAAITQEVEGDAADFRGHAGIRRWWSDLHDFTTASARMFWRCV